MRKSLEESGKSTSRRVPMPAPTGGWNARDPFTSMKKTEAIYLDNFFPRRTDVMLRKGWEAFASIPEDLIATPHNVQSLLSYSSPTGAKKLFACDASGIYNVTAGGAIASPALALTSGQVESVNMTTSGGSFLWCCNGTDSVSLYDGTTWTAITAISTPAITGLATTLMTNCSIFKNRIIITKKDSLSFWYLPLNAIAGAATEFPLGSLFNLGGYLVATTSWSLDAGEGMDDYFVAITSEGEVAVYKGIDPSSASTFALVGIYKLGKPLGKRCFHKIGGDVLVLTEGGLFPLSKALISANINSASAVSDKISDAWTSFTSSFSGLFGWQAVTLPSANMLLINVPIVQDAALNISYSYQFVMNTQTGAWARFFNQHSQVWCVHDGELYFANHNFIRKAWTGQTDNNGPIEAKVKSAFSNLGYAGNKHIPLVRPIMTSTADVTLQLGIDSDYADELTSSSFVTSNTTVALWDQAKWDQAKWTANLTISKWRTVFHRPGNALSLRLRLSAKNVSLTWNATDYLVEDAGLL